MTGWYRSSVVVLAAWQICFTSGNKACTYHTYNYGHSRVVAYNCHDWEYCCSGVCCDYPVLIHKLWYFWVGILALAFFLLLASITWYKKRYYGRVLRVHPAAIGPGAVHMHTVTTQQYIHTPTYPGSYVSVPPGPYVSAPPGPPPPYSSLPGQTQGKQPPPAGPMQPAYLPAGMTPDNDSSNLF
ncbi:vesicular, overexpressed in cancer, prosurvival protein 1-like [Haliotis rubra]|uniref:vesicular, overexpressed in cancer, prosurvival protein 1-like n=1 Tax=Haliotis rubra TaxID=36100 RepID=UPI001EE54273|nr:vesicular, overexpressed in cancer, prosurvival protein 1-like [Haliotis rubra]